MTEINKPSYGVIVGRFQVPYLHEGHIELLNKVRAYHQHVIVFLGVAPGGASTHNPLDYDNRRRMIQCEFPQFIICPIPDCSSDEAWSESLDNKIAEIVSYGKVTLYGGRQSFVPHYKGKHSPVELQLSVSHLSGTLLRNEVTNFVQDSVHFREGIIYSINNMFPRVITCVDVAIMFNGTDGLQVLLGRKVGETKWRFVGGHADPKSESFETDAKREAFEETGLDINSISYIGSRLIDDWRWRNAPDKIKTLFFIGWTNIPKFKANDDINELKWFNITTEGFPPTVAEHDPLVDMLIDYYNDGNYND